MPHVTALKKPDFLIIGAGIIGLATAWELTRAGASVEIVDRGLAGRESSWAGGGMLFPLWPWEYSEPVTALTELSRTLYPEWVAGLQAESGIDPEYWQSGLFALPPADFDRARAWCATRGLRAELVRGGELSPLLSIHERGIWLPDAAQVRNPRLIQALMRALRARGVIVREHTAVAELIVEAGRLTGVKTSGGDLSARAAVVCAGAWSVQLLGALAGGISIFPVCGQMLLYRMAPGVVSSMVLQGERYLIPRADGHILVGSTLEYTGFDKAPTRSASLDLHAAAVAMMPALEKLRPIGHWAGLRPGSPGNVPVIARHPEVDNLYLNGGHFRYGLTMAPAAAKLLADLVSGHAAPSATRAYAWPEARRGLLAE